MPSSAYVTMATAAEAVAAIHRLHSRLFLDRCVMVELAPVREDSREKARQQKPPATGVSMSQQYRERRGMVYELDCSGQRLTLRLLFQEEQSSQRRIEASVRELEAAATGATLQLALGAVAEEWARLSAERGAPEIAWAEVTAVLKTVRAL
jgi:hypothetical protein